MAMGESACFAEEIKEDIVKTVVGETAYNRFIEARSAAFGPGFLEYNEGSIEIPDDDPADMEPAVKEFVESYTAVCDAFYEATHIHIEMCYHDSDVGSCYDAVGEWYWDAEYSDLYMPTPALEEFRKKYGEDAYERNFFTVYG